jgi:NTP pyrophosphatase (non-canonical NTP hydrolase)
MKNFQNYIGGFQRITFPTSTPLSMSKHLQREADELVNELEQSDIAIRPEHVHDELADIFILCIGIAYLIGVSLMECVIKKMAVNVNRKWKAPDKDGVIEHQEVE